MDNEAVAAVEAGDEGKFQQLFDQMLSLVENDGEAVADDELVESDVILPRATSRSRRPPASSPATA